MSKITNFGAFVKLSTGIEGLAHISELDSKEVQKVEDVLQAGQQATFKVIKVNSDERKLGLSLKALKNESEKAAEQSPQDIPTKQMPKVAKKTKVKSGTTKRVGELESPLKQALTEHAARVSEELEEEE